MPPTKIAIKEWADNALKRAAIGRFLRNARPKLLFKSGLLWGSIAGMLKIYHHWAKLLYKGLQWVAMGVLSINYPPEQNSDIRVDCNRQ